MSSWGISTTQIVNSLGEVIVDKNFGCLEVLSEGTVVASSGGYNNFMEITVPTAGIINPMVFIKPILHVQYLIGPMWTDRIYISTPLGAGTQIEFKTCGIRSDADPGAGIGIAIHKPDGTVAYSSRRRYMRIVDFLEVLDSGFSAIRPGDSYDIAFDGGGGVIGHWVRHPTRPIPANTWWLARCTGLSPDPGSNTRVRVFQRTSTTEYYMGMDTGGTITDANAIWLNGGNLVLPAIPAFSMHLIGEDA